jgi:hypothetical protein
LLFISICWIRTLYWSEKTNHKTLYWIQSKCEWNWYQSSIHCMNQLLNCLIVVICWNLFFSWNIVKLNGWMNFVFVSVDG